MTEKVYKIRTTSGFFDFANLDKNEIDVGDIASALSRINRYTGHTTRPYTVAMHSLYVAYMMALDGLSVRLQLLGLMHDFHEAYFSDMSSPLKWFLRDYYGFDANEYCDKIDQSLYKKLHLQVPTFEEHAIVKKYDYRAYEHERFYLFDNGAEVYSAEKISGDNPSTDVKNFAIFFDINVPVSNGYFSYDETDYYKTDQKYWEKSLLDVYYGMRVKLPNKVAYIKNVMDSVLAFDPETFYKNHGISYVKRVVGEIVKMKKVQFTKK